MPCAQGKEVTRSKSELKPRKSVGGRGEPAADTTPTTNHKDYLMAIFTQTKPGRNPAPEGAHIGVLREAMTIDGYDTPGLYFGTSTGQLFASADEGDSWSEIASYLPSISSVEVVVLD